MKAIRVRAYQNMVSYRKPTSFSIKESFPLPPYSGVIGMVHAACGFEEYVPMKVSVQGEYFSSITENYIKYEFGAGTFFEAERHQLSIPSQDKKPYGINRGFGSIQLLIDVDLLLHIIPEDEKKIDEIAKGLLNPGKYLSLGRWEDLLRIDEVSIVEIEKTILDDSVTLEQDAYVPIELLKKDMNLFSKDESTRYRIGKVFSTTKDKLGYRKWEEIIPVSHVCRKSKLYEDVEIWCERLENNDIIPVFPA